MDLIVLHFEKCTMYYVGLGLCTRMQVYFQSQGYRYDSVFSTPLCLRSSHIFGIRQSATKISFFMAAVWGYGLCFFSLPPQYENWYIFMHLTCHGMVMRRLLFRGDYFFLKSHPFYASLNVMRLCAAEKLKLSFGISDHEQCGFIWFTAFDIHACLVWFNSTIF